MEENTKKKSFPAGKLWQEVNEARRNVILTATVLTSMRIKPLIKPSIPTLTRLESEFRCCTPRTIFDGFFAKMTRAPFPILWNRIISIFFH